MLTESFRANSYIVDARIQIGIRMYNVISILKDDPKTSKKLVLDLLEKVEEERIQDVYGHATVNICENNKRLLTILLKLIKKKKKILKSIKKNTFLKCNFFETLVDQSHKVDKDILKFTLYQNIWDYYHSS